MARPWAGSGIGDEPHITTPADPANLIVPCMGHLPQQHSAVPILNTNHRL